MAASPTTRGHLSIEVHLDPDEGARALAADVRNGLTAAHKWLPSKWFYDEVGSRLFDDITRLPEYYPTRREQAILDRYGADIAAASEASTLIELGSGTSTKTRTLLDALDGAGTLKRFVAFDCSEEVLLEASETIGGAYPHIDVHAVVGDFERHLQFLENCTGDRAMVAFLGGTIGNFAPAERARFLAALAAAVPEGTQFLLGTDLVKDPARLVAAYDDATGVTAAFNRNVLAVVNRVLDGDIDVDCFEHVAMWDASEERIEMRLRCRRSHRAHLRAIDLQISFSDGEDIRTEWSSKFRRAGVEAELIRAGFALDHWWTDPEGDFALSLSTRTRSPRIP